MTTPGKQVIYVDVDDEITGIIDKMNATEARVVALVLPKRATVFQSLVNMKLLKRRADDAKKHVVLITSEAGLLPLAGAAGMYVAPTLQSKPEVPDIPAGNALPEDIDEEETVSLSGDDLDASKQNMAIGALAAGHTPGVNELADDVVELDSAPKHAGPTNPLLKQQKPPKELAAAAAAKPGGAAGKGKKFSVPNFFKFRKGLLFAGLALVVFIVLLYLGLAVLPKATIVVKTDSTDVNASVNMKLNTTATSVDVAQGVVPAQKQQIQKEYTQTVPASGEENRGNKAAGNITMTAQACAPSLGTPDPVSAGTGISTNGLTYITQSNATFTFDGFSGGSCANYKTDPINITAQQAGASYNADSADFTVAGRSEISASGSASGGTDKIAKIVQQSDIDSAKQKLANASDKDSYKQQLQSKLENEKLYAITPTFNAKASSVSTNVKAGEEGSSVTVTETVTYTMYGARQDDLQKVIDEAINKQIDTAKQSIQDDGLSDAGFSAPNLGDGDQLDVNVSTTAAVGPHLNVDKLKEEAVGKKSGVVKDLIKANPGVLDVRVDYSPFWVTKAPKADKITIVFQKSSEHSSANGQ